MDNFFSFVKQDEPQDNKAIENEEVETPTNEDKPHRSSRFSSFFHQPKAPASPAENPVNPQQTSAQSTPSGPPPGFSKFFGGQPPQQAPTPPQQHQQSQPPQIHPQQPPHVLKDTVLRSPLKVQFQRDHLLLHLMIISLWPCFIRRNQSNNLLFPRSQHLILIKN